MVDDLADFFAQQVGLKAAAEPVEGPAERIACGREGFVMAVVRNDCVAVVEGFRIYKGAQYPAQAVYAVAVAGRNADRAFGQGAVRCRIRFIYQHQQFLVGTEREFRGNGRTCCKACRVGHVNHDLRPFDARHRALDAHLFQPVVRCADTRRVEEPEDDPVDVDPLLDDVARRAGDVGNQDALFVEQAVEQCALADVRSSRDRYGDPLLDGIPERERIAQGVDMRPDPLHRLPQLRAVGEFDLFLRKVEFQFEERSEFQQLFAQSFQRVGITSPHLVRGERMGRARR